MRIWLRDAGKLGFVATFPDDSIERVAIAIYDLATGEETRVETSRPITHGVVVSPDGRYAFVSNEAVGATRGTLDVVDIAAGRLVASTELHYQPGGIGFWKMEGHEPHPY